MVYISPMNCFFGHKAQMDSASSIPQKQRKGVSAMRNFLKKLFGFATENKKPVLSGADLAKQSVLRASVKFDANLHLYQAVLPTGFEIESRQEGDNGVEYYIVYNDGKGEERLAGIIEFKEMLPTISVSIPVSVKASKDMNVLAYSRLHKREWIQFIVRHADGESDGHEIPMFSVADFESIFAGLKFRKGHINMDDGRLLVQKITGGNLDGLSKTFYKMATC